MHMVDQESRTRRVFVSYARKDREIVQRLRSGLERLRLDVWVDDRLSGGQDWWAVILEQIQKCDAIVVAVSPALLESQASALERQYGRQLGKIMLPVCVRPVRTEFLPPDLAALQFVDYSTPGPDAAFELADALANVPYAPALPDPLPEPPPTPLGYFERLADRVHAPTLTLDEQLALVARLRTALDREEHRPAALELLSTLQRRDDLYNVPAREIESLSARGPDPAVPGRDPPTPDAPTPAPQGPYVPPGWYPDPSGRHRLRWFDQDWTDWASDGRLVIENRL